MCRFVEIPGKEYFTFIRADVKETKIVFLRERFHCSVRVNGARPGECRIDNVPTYAVVCHRWIVDIIGSEPEKWRPTTRETADHSLPYITAIALIDGEVTNKQFEPERFTDPKIWKFLENVKVQRNAELSALYPGAVANIVHVDLADGRRLTRRVDYPLGHARNPLKDSEVEGKFFALVVPTIGEKRAKRIVDLAWKLDEATNVDELMKALEMPEQGQE